MFGIRIGVAILVFFTARFLLDLLLLERLFPGPVAAVMSLAGGVAAAWFVFSATAGQVAGGALRTAGLWAMIAGAVGFAIGFFGPLIWAPEANQGPLLGIFITGPGGFLLGGVAGLIAGIVRR